jgi:Lrp/AsnC family leucine-responsive transcriptional regulator
MKEEKRLNLLKLLMKNSRMSDRELAKRLQVSQPTLTRIRHVLEKKGYIRSYTVTPDFGKMGYAILAFIFGKLRSYPKTSKAEELVKQASEWVTKRPNVIYAADGQGLSGKDLVMVSYHRDFQDYVEFIHSYAFEWGRIVSEFETFIVSLKSELTLKPFDLKHLAYDN